MNILKNILLPIKKMNKREGVILFILVVSAIGFRLFLMRYRFAVCFDEVNYLKLGASGALYGLRQILHPYWTPFYPLTVALFSKIVPNYELIGRLVSIFCGGLILIPVFLFAKSFLDKRPLYYALFLLAFSPGWAFMSTYAHTESLYTFLSFSGFYLFWMCLKKQSWVYSVLSGILFAFTYLTRPEGIGFLLVSVGILILISLYSFYKKTGYKSALLGVVLIFTFVVFALPYLIYLHQVTGRWIISAKQKSLQQAEAVVFLDKQEEGYNFDLLSEDNKTLMTDQMFHIGNFVQEKIEKPVVSVTLPLLLKKYFKNLTLVINESIPKSLSMVILFFVILGLFDAPWGKERTLREFYTLSFFVFFWFLLIPLFHITSRYFMPLFPLCFIWAGRGIDSFLIWLNASLSKTERQGFKRKLSYIIAFLILTLGFTPQLNYILTRKAKLNDYWSDPVEQKTAGLWLKAHSKKIPVIMSKNHTASFYAGNYNIAQSVSVPLNAIDRVLAYAKCRDVDYILISERYMEWYPNMNDLLYEKKIPDTLELVYKAKDAVGLKVVIYKLKG